MNGGLRRAAALQGLTLTVAGSLSDLPHVAIQESLSVVLVILIVVVVLVTVTFPATTRFVDCSDY